MQIPINAPGPATLEFLKHAAELYKQGMYTYPTVIQGHLSFIPKELFGSFRPNDSDQEIRVVSNDEIMIGLVDLDCPK